MSDHSHQWDYQSQADADPPMNHIQPCEYNRCGCGVVIPLHRAPGARGGYWTTTILRVAVKPAADMR